MPSKTQLLKYKLEYETTPITIDELCDKYGEHKSALKGYTKWTKLPMETSFDSPGTELVSVKESLPEPLGTEEPEDEVDRDIQEFRKITASVVLKVAQDISRSPFPDGSDLRVLKEASSIVNDITKNKKGPEGPSVHVYVQQLTERFRDDI